MTSTYPAFFASLSERGFAPHPWQGELATERTCANRLVRIPTGLGKTQGVLGAWLYHRVQRGDERWPRRLVWCLPMRTLVEQVAADIRKMLEAAGLDVAVHALMGGSEPVEWHLQPESNAVLVGTQDMLISRALARGYASPRARWPMEFGLLNQDCLWVLDEVQLMDVGLATTAQLQQFREDERARDVRPCYSWWMSATLQPEWLASVDTQALVEGLDAAKLLVRTEDRKGDLWEKVEKPLSVVAPLDESGLAALVSERHAAQSSGGLTLVIVNTVTRACAVYEDLRILKTKGLTADLRLCHSRFRPHERKRWRETFLNREDCASTNRIIVATQVVEAGVDISATCLVTDLAPWPSLVQRFGRAARYGGCAQVVVVDSDAVDDKSAAPYRIDEFAGARGALQGLGDVSLASLERFELSLSTEARQTLYPYAPSHLLLRRELDELFDTTPDLTGADLDISRFIRSGAERDCLVFWAAWEDVNPLKTLQPSHDALCGVPFFDVRKWLFDGAKLKDGMRAFVWDYLDDRWCPAKPDSILPGRTVLVHVECGGYDPQMGFTGKPMAKKALVAEVPATPPTPATRTELGQDSEALSVAQEYQTIAEHGRRVGSATLALARMIGVPDHEQACLFLAGLLHDLGKAHSTFQKRIVAADKPKGDDLAKAPDAAWSTRTSLCGFRHELASALALFEVLAMEAPNHPALLGAHSELIECGALSLDIPPPRPSGLGRVLAGLSADDFDLLAYLVASHHGKVRAALHACPADQEVTGDTAAQMPIRGVREDDAIPEFPVALPDGSVSTLPPLTLHLAPAHLGLSSRYGRSWRERTLTLQERTGPFALAFLESILRVADIRVSRGETVPASSTAVPSSEA